MGDVLVTGAAGFVGQNLVPALVENGNQVMAVDLKPEPPDTYKHLLGDGLEYIQGSILDENFLSNVVLTRANDFDRIFHLAAVVGVNRYIDTQDPLYVMEVNIEGTKNILERIRNDRTRLIYTSTSEIYGKNPRTPWSEDDDQVLGPPTVSRWSYSVSKSTCEHMIHMLTAVEDGLNATILRPFNLYGPHQRPDFVIPKFIDRVLDGEPPQIYGDGQQTRCFTYIEDFVGAALTASTTEAGKNEVFNIGRTVEMPIADLAETVVEVSDENVTPEHVDVEDVYDQEYEEPDERIPDISRAKRKLDWEPEIDLREGISRTYKWAKEQTDA